MSILLSASGGFVESIKDFWNSTGIMADISYEGYYLGIWGLFIMMGIACVLLYFAIVKKFEPNLLLSIAFGMFIINIPGAYEILFAPIGEGGGGGGLFTYLYTGVQWVIFPPLIFLGIGAMTDFGPLIANPKSMLLGAAAQFGIFITFIGALLLGFNQAGAASIAIIGGADGPTAIYLTQRLAEFAAFGNGEPGTANLLAPIAIAAYSYMALVPVIQPPIMRLLTTKKERQIKMEQLRPVSKKEKIIFPLLVTAVTGLLLPSALPLIGMLMLGNLLKESGVVPRLSKTAENELINIVTIFLGVTVGATAYAPKFLQVQTLFILFLGAAAFAFGTASGVLLGKLMCKLTKGKINPLIGAAGVSAVPMAARVAQDVGRKENPENYLLMHAMGPNVAGVISSAVVAGVLIAMFG